MTVEIPKPHPSSYYVCNIVLRALCRFRVHGREHAPNESQPMIVTSNHLSYFDGLAALAGTRNNYPVATAVKYKDTFFMGNLLKIFAAPIWIQQNKPDRKALKHLLGILEANHPIAIAVEGTRSKTAALQKGLEGAAFIARKANVPIVPWVFEGTEKILQHPRPRVNVYIGKPYRLPQNRTTLEDDADRMMCAMAALLPESYHGYYAGNPLIDEMREFVTE